MTANSPPDAKTIGMTFAFSGLPDDFCERVVRQALTGRDHVPEGARAALRKAVGACVKVPGFRDAGLAQAPLLQEPVLRLVRVRDDLARAVVRVWSESQRELREMIVAYLIDKGLLDGEPDYSTNRIEVAEPDQHWDDAMVELFERYRDLDRHDLLLMCYYITGRVTQPVEDAHPPSSPVWAELSGTLEQVLRKLRSLPANAPEWDNGVSGFVRDIESIRQEKIDEAREVADLGSQLATLAEEHGELLRFFEWDAEGKRAGQPQAWADLGVAREVVSRLRNLLDEYAPVHPMAALRSEEAERGPRRAELQRQVDALLSEFAGLEVQEATPEAPAIEIEPGPPADPVPAPPREEQEIQGQAETEADELSPLRTNNERLAAENLSLQLEIDGLKRNANDLSSDASESRNLAEMWRLLFQDSQRSKDPVVDDQLPEFESVAQVVELAEERLGDRLSFHLNARSDTGIPFDKPRQAWDALEWLATVYYGAKTGETPEPDFDMSLRQACGWRYTPDQSAVTIGQFPSYYETRVGNRKRHLLEHIGTGNGYGRGTIRIAFAWDADEKKVLIGYAGRHQRTVAS